MEEDGGESVGSGAADMPAMGVGIGVGVGVGASDDSIEVSSTSHADVSAVSLYRGTFNIDDAASASASSTASTASASTSVKNVSTPATKGKSTKAKNKPSPTSVDMFEMFLAETAVEAEEVQEEADDEQDGSLTLAQVRAALRGDSVESDDVGGGADDARALFNLLRKDAETVDFFAFLVGVALLEVGDPEAALPAFESAIAINEGNPVRRRELAKAFIRRGDAYWALDRIEEAQASFQKGIVQFPDHYEGWAKIARAMDRLGDGERAERARYEERQARIRVGAPLDDADATSDPSPSEASP